MRTTIDLDPTVLRELKLRASEERKSLGQVASELLAPALKRQRSSAGDFVWTPARGHLLVDLEDKDALYRVLDATGPASVDE